MSKFLIVKLDQYAGNVDEIVCVALTGSGEDRYGAKQARKVFDSKVLPLLGDVDQEYPELPIEFMNFSTDYGSMAYALDSESTDYLRLGIDKYTSGEALDNMIEIWKKAYGETLEIVVEDYLPVKILGFDLVTVEEYRTLIL